MPIRLALFQRESRPLDGLCGQLQCAGYEVLAHDHGVGILGLAEYSGVDVLLVDGDIEEAEALIKEIKNSPRTSDLPIMLIVEEASSCLSRFSTTEHFDDVVILPVFHDEFQDRVRNLARLTSMRSELQRRMQVQSDFSGDQHGHNTSVATIDRLSILFVGSADDSRTAMVDLLGQATTIKYAETPSDALGQLRQNHTDIVIANSETTLPHELLTFCQQIALSAHLADLPIVLMTGSDTSASLELFCRDCQVDLLRLPVMPIATDKRLRVLARQHRLKARLRDVAAGKPTTSMIDGLTGLYGHSFLHHYLNRSIAESRERQLPLSLITIRIEELAYVNEVLGYPMGDQLIARLAMTLIGNCRAQDLVARNSGTTICIALNDTSVHEAQAVGGRLKQILQEAITRWANEHRTHLDLIVEMTGLSPYDDARTMISRANQRSTVHPLCRAS
ncbi:MAG: diguanylate cyclase domain-containing protein [Geminicoccaceae bacterium]